MNHDWYEIFRQFWWLIFPMFWMVAGAARLWSRHARANRLIELVKTYAEQGKEPPPEILAALQGPFGAHAREEWRDYRPRRNHSWVPVFLFAALACGFVFLAHGHQAVSQDDMAGLTFAAIIMVGLALGFLVAALTGRRDDTDRTLPK